MVRPESFKFEAQLPPSDGFSIFLRANDQKWIYLQINGNSEPYATMTYR